MTCTYISSIWDFEIKIHGDFNLDTALLDRLIQSKSGMNFYPFNQVDKFDFFFSYFSLSLYLYLVQPDPYPNLIFSKLHRLISLGSTTLKFLNFPFQETKSDTTCGARPHLHHASKKGKNASQQLRANFSSHFSPCSLKSTSGACASSCMSIPPQLRLHFCRYIPTNTS